MNISLELDFEDAVQFRDWLRKWHGGIEFGFAAMVLQVASDIDNAIQNEEGRMYDQQQERLMESGGVDDSKYRQDAFYSAPGLLRNRRFCRRPMNGNRPPSALGTGT